MLLAAWIVLNFKWGSVVSNPWGKNSPAKLCAKNPPKTEPLHPPLRSRCFRDRRGSLGRRAPSSEAHELAPRRHGVAGGRGAFGLQFDLGSAVCRTASVPGRQRSDCNLRNITNGSQKRKWNAPLLEAFPQCHGFSKM